MRMIGLSKSRFRRLLGIWFPSLRVGGLLFLWLAIAVTIFRTVDSPATVANKITQQLAEGRIPHWKLDVVQGLYWGAAANVAITLLLIVTMRFWCHQTATPAQVPPGHSKPSRSFVVILFLIVVAAGALRWRLAHGSLWWDEMWNTKMAIVGEFRTGSKHPDTLRFYPSDFARCAWYYQKPTNHVPTALASKVCYLTWSKLTDAEDGAFNEFVLRLPVFLSALGSVALVGLSVRHWVSDGAGLLAAALLAIHPWFIRYGIDARAYGPVVFFSLVGLWALSNALAADRFRYWALFALAQLFLMWSNMHCLWFCGSTTIVASILILTGKSPAIYWPKFGRLIAANAFAAAAFLQVYSPNLFQFYRWSSLIQDGSVLDFAMLRSTFSQVLFGIEPEWPAHTIEAEGLVSWHSLTGGNLWLMWGSIALFAVTSICGIAFLFKRNRTVAALICALIGGAVTFMSAASLFDIYFYPRFLTTALPVAVIAFAAGVWQCGKWISRRVSFITPEATCLTAFFLYGAICLPEISVLQQRSYAPMREVATFLNERRKEEQRVSILGYGLGSRILRLYDHGLDYAITPPGEKEVRQALADARASNRTLYVFYGYPAFNRSTMPGGFLLLDNPDLFQEVAAFKGIEPEFYFRILKATNGAGEH